jgi:polyhydroxybutyrate depolymerase
MKHIFHSLVFGSTIIEQREILVKGQKRFYLLHRPPKFTKNSSVVILLHGGTQSMRKVLEDNAGGKRWEELSNLHGFLLIVPNASNQDGDTLGNKQTWNDCRITTNDSKIHSSADDVIFLKDLKDTIVKSEGASPDKFFLTGSSNGGMMTLRMAIEVPDLFKSYAAIIASLPLKSECPAPTKPVALFMLNGTEDPLIPWKGGPAGRPGYEDEIITPEKTRDLWVTLNKVDLQKTEISTLPDIDTRVGKKWSSSRIVKSKYYGKIPIEFYRVDGGGHSLPSKLYQIPRFLERRLVGFQNHDIEGADEIWGFFVRSKL